MIVYRQFVLRLRKKHNDNWVKLGHLIIVFILCIKQVSNTMPHSRDYDAVVIGSGPGDEGAAMDGFKQEHVAVIERYHNVGGGCTHWGTIPSKPFCHAVSRDDDLIKAAL